MNNALYAKEVKCPLCTKEFSTMKVRRNFCIVDKRDEDFCVHYKSFNPMFYEIFVCPCCGYAASERTFSELSKLEIGKLMDFYSSFKVERSFCGERSINDAVDSYKLALYAASSKSSKDSIIAGICLKIAWLYRILKDEKEQIFLNHALSNYKKAYDIERFPIGNFDEITIQYLLGELSRRTDKYEDAVRWFSRAVSNPERFTNPRIEKMAREQWTLASEQKRNSKKIETL